MGVHESHSVRGSVYWPGTHRTYSLKWHKSPAGSNQLVSTTPPSQFFGLLSASTIFRQCFPFFGWLCLKLHPDYLYVSSRNKREGLRRVSRNWAEGKCDRSEKTQAACRTGIELRHEQNADW